MNLYDIIYDKDARISGIIITQGTVEHNILWDNDVVGIVTENDDSLKIIDHVELEKYLVVDVLHSGKSGKKNSSKVGSKYDKRRGKVLLLNRNELEKGRSLRLFLFEKDFFNEITTDKPCHLLYTTPFESMYNRKGFTFLRTANSIYKLSKVSD